jgi:hypothetical protein
LSAQLPSANLPLHAGDQRGLASTALRTGFMGELRCASGAFGMALRPSRCEALLASNPTRVEEEDACHWRGGNGVVAGSVGF